MTRNNFLQKLTAGNRKKNIYSRQPKSLANDFMFSKQYRYLLLEITYRDVIVKTADLLGLITDSLNTGFCHLTIQNLLNFRTIEF